MVASSSNVLDPRLRRSVSFAQRATQGLVARDGVAMIVAIGVMT